MKETHLLTSQPQINGEERGAGGDSGRSTGDSPSVSVVQTAASPGTPASLLGSPQRAQAPTSSAWVVCTGHTWPPPARGPAHRPAWSGTCGLRRLPYTGHSCLQAGERKLFCPMYRNRRQKKSTWKRMINTLIREEQRTSAKRKYYKQLVRADDGNK